MIVNMLSNILLFLSSWCFCVCICLTLPSFYQMLLYIFKDNVRPTYRDVDCVFFIYCSLKSDFPFPVKIFFILTYLLSKDTKMDTLESIVYITFMVNVHGSLFLYPYVLPFYIFFCFKFIVLGHYNFGFFKNSTWAS